MINKYLFDYDLPLRLIADKPAAPRDCSRLLVYDTTNDTIVFDYFYNLTQYLPKKSYLVMNNTKVLPARIILKKQTGGKVEALFLVNELAPSSKYQVLSIKQDTIRAYVDRKVSVGDKLYFDNEFFITVAGQEEHIFTFQFNFSRGKLFELLEKNGTMPIPPYIKHSPLPPDELKISYQTIFAQASNKVRQAGSAAAPTASLHFTKRVFQKLETSNIRHFFLTLHVGMGTFAPITDDNIKRKALHEEWYEITPDTKQSITSRKLQGYELTAVGTTVVRAMEALTISNIPTSSRNAGLRGVSKDQTINSFIGKTDIFIYPPYDFHMVDHLITNFHLPKSSLIMLVEAFLQHKRAKRHLIDLYRTAIENNFRFYSFGDAMLIL